MEKQHENEETMYRYWLARREEALQSLTIAEQQLGLLKPLNTEQQDRWTQLWLEEQRPESD